MVVLPEPCRPTSMMTLGGGPPRSSLFLPSVPPSTSMSSSLTIESTCCAGERLPMTSAPMAFCFTRSTNWRATRRFTSASIKARRTSRRATLTSSSVNLPCPLKLVKIPSRRFDKLSNIAIRAKSSLRQSPIMTLLYHSFNFRAMLCGEKQIVHHVLGHNNEWPQEWPLVVVPHCDSAWKLSLFNQSVPAHLCWLSVAPR